MELVRQTWKGVVPIRDTFADLLFRKLFELDPSLRPLFRGDLRDQGRNFVAMMSIAVRNLEHPDRVSAALRELGRRHAHYGARAHHYATFRTALILSLDLSLGEAFTEEARPAWEETYELLSRAMTAPR